MVAARSPLREEPVNTGNGLLVIWREGEESIQKHGRGKDHTSNGETNQYMDWRFWPWDNWGPKHSSLSSEPFCTLPSSGTSWPSYSLSWNACKLISVRRHVFEYLMQAKRCIQNSIQLAELIFISKNQNTLKISLILLFSYLSTSQIDFWASVHTQYIDFFFSSLRYGLLTVT